VKCPLPSCFKRLRLYHSRDAKERKIEIKYG
jgi:hypothetical protein